MNRVVVTRPFCGLLYMQVCAIANATDAEILETCNRANICGTSLGWAQVIRDPEPESGRIAPVVCEDNNTRIHFMVAC